MGAIMDWGCFVECRTGALGRSNELGRSETAAQAWSLLSTAAAANGATCTAQEAGGQGLLHLRHMKSRPLCMADISAAVRSSLTTCSRLPAMCSQRQAVPAGRGGAAAARAVVRLGAWHRGLANCHGQPHLHTLLVRGQVYWGNMRAPLARKPPAAVPAHRPRCLLAVTCSLAPLHCCLPCRWPLLPSC